MKQIIEAARKKGLKISKNMFQEGWCIDLPNGGCYNALTLADLRSFVRGY